MSFTGTSLADGQVAASKTTIYTSSGVKTIVKSVNVFNTAATTETIKVYVTRSGSTSRLVAQVQLDQNEFAYILSDGETIVLSASDTIDAETTNATSVDYTVTGATE